MTTPDETPEPITRTYQLVPTDPAVPIGIEDLTSAVDHVRRVYHKEAQILATGNWLRIIPDGNAITLTYTYTPKEPTTS